MSALQPEIPFQCLSGAIDGGEHRLMVRVYYEDTDFTGLVYHANYLKYFERGRSDFLRVRGVHHHELRAHEDPLAFAVTHIDLRYRRPARIDDVVTVRTRVARVQGARIVMAQVCERDGAVLCEGQFDIACIDGDGRPRRLPKALVAALGYGEALQIGEEKPAEKT